MFCVESITYPGGAMYGLILLPIIAFDIFLLLEFLENNNLFIYNGICGFIF